MLSAPCAIYKRVLNPVNTAKIDGKALKAPWVNKDGKVMSSVYFLLTTPDGRALLKSNEWLRSLITTKYLNSIFKDNKCDSIESWLTNYNEEGELASNSSGAASVSMFAAKQESSPACSPRSGP